MNRLPPSARTAVAAVLIATANSLAAPLDPNAFASLGTLNPSGGTYTLNTDGTPTLTVGNTTYTGVTRSRGAGLRDLAVFTFDDVNIASGVTLNTVGDRAVVILSRAGISVGGTINATSGSYDFDATVGQGGHGNRGDDAGGGGGGFGGAGGESNTFFFPQPGGLPYGDLIARLEGGSRGGEGAGLNPRAGSGGGALELGATGTINVASTGRVFARGGDGGTSGGIGFGSGGGSGGGLLLHADRYTLATGSLLDVTGGTGAVQLSRNTQTRGNGGGGGGGRIAVGIDLYVASGAGPTLPSTAGMDAFGNFGGGTGEAQGRKGQDGSRHAFAQTTLVNSGVTYNFQPVIVGYAGFSTIDLTVQPGGRANKTGDYVNPGIVTVGGTFTATGSIAGGTYRLEGGTIVAPSYDATNTPLLEGRGTFTGRIVGGTPTFETIVRASGGVLTVGDATRADAIDTDVLLVTANATQTAPAGRLVLLDADRALIGAAFLGEGTTLSAPNGITLRAGTGVLVSGNDASVSGAFTNAGTVTGPSTGGRFLTFTGDVDGTGSYTGNVKFSDGFSPGNSPASVSLGNVAFDATTTLTIELGGTTPGTGFDRLLISGNATLGGATLDLRLINGFTPTAAASFEILDIGGTRGGIFAGLNEGALVGNFGGTNLFITYAGGDGNDVALGTAVPEPALLAMIGLSGLALMRRRRR